MRLPDDESSRLAGDYLSLNRRNWDERVAVHVASGFYAVERFVAGEDHLHGFETEELGDVAGKRVVHLQCHFGMDTLSLARRGASVTGLDFSAPAIAEARALAGRLGVEARFVEANVYDAVEALGERYEIVYTGKGALNWIPDLGAWARTAAALLEPGGVLYLVEYHPLPLMLAEDSLEFEWPYFNTGAEVWDEPGDYADPDAVLENARTVEWPHPISEVICSVIDAGLRRVLPRVRRVVLCSFLVHGGGRASALRDARRHARAAAHVLASRREAGRARHDRNPKRSGRLRACLTQPSMAMARLLRSSSGSHSRSATS
jgi:SAM-dependent methyltransferase